MGENVLEDLIRRVRRMPPGWSARLRYALFAKGGFTPALISRAAQEKILLVDLPRLYGT